VSTLDNKEGRAEALPVPQAFLVAFRSYPFPLAS
jgi:hypothetical protein